MKTTNTVVLTGPIVTPPVSDRTGGGAPVCNFDMETVDEWVDPRGDTKHRVDRHRVAAFGAAGLHAASLRVGDYVVVRGRVRYREHAGGRSAEIVAAVVAGEG
jgi:single-stranded DNA-binding protein